MSSDQPSKLPAPTDKRDSLWAPVEKAAIGHRTRYAAVGAPDTVRHRLQQILEETTANELILTGQIFDHVARLRSFEIAAGVLEKM
jgi:alkanesulfonate monooxygenase SsuD/methylene tetrahydromethanopterin reductase-like flavin-dependent oxidoreductase (luciferase family)